MSDNFFCWFPPHCHLTLINVAPLCHLPTPWLFGRMLSVRQVLKSQKFCYWKNANFHTFLNVDVPIMIDAWLTSCWHWKLTVVLKHFHFGYLVIDSFYCVRSLLVYLVVKNDKRCSSFPPNLRILGTNALVNFSILLVMLPFFVLAPKNVKWWYSHA